MSGFNQFTDFVVITASGRGGPEDGAAAGGQEGRGGVQQRQVPRHCTLYCTVLYTVLYCTKLYCTVLYCVQIRSPAPVQHLNHARVTTGHICPSHLRSMQSSIRLDTLTCAHKKK